ncbi:DUF3828 domain-containing protein [Halorientalis pallida]|uniref:Uncharacterized protein n=1 Tax=Halorientalis pallida TaxID=2479928 RepID=A0A498KWC6_9EURY|nr:DUF3828 domain-containing protein [Halorientalis pallida]RXK49115.1 hypothetical protein EAF64_09300 [Halorientalis pallida]
MNKSSRRGYIAGLVGVAALSGCQDVLDGTSGSGGSEPDEDDDDDDSGADEADGPAAAVETFYAALDAGRFDVANGLLHNETSQPPVTEEQYGSLDEGSVSASATEVVEQSEGRAVVRTTLDATFADTDRQITRELEIELRTETGEWRLYSVESVDDTGEAPADEPTPEEEPTPDSGPGPRPPGDPGAVVTEFYAALNDGDRAAANARLHSEAEGIDVTQQAADSMEEASLTAERVTVVSEARSSATVEATVTLSPAGSDREQSNRVRIELRPENGQWRIYSAGQAR